MKNRFSRTGFSKPKLNYLLRAEATSTAHATVQESALRLIPSFLMKTRTAVTLLSYLLRAEATSTAHATVQPTIGLFPIPMNPIISTCAGTDEEPANCASECMRPSVSVNP